MELLEKIKTRIKSLESEIEWVREDRQNMTDDSELKWSYVDEIDYIKEIAILKSLIN